MITGCVVNAAPDAAPTAEVVTAMDVGVPAVPVAVKVTGEPDREPDVAVRVLLPLVVPRVHAGEAAIPEELVDTTPEDASEPPPDATANVTATPCTALPWASVTTTDGAVEMAEPDVAD